jgi:hypothetical protein
MSRDGRIGFFTDTIVCPDILRAGKGGVYKRTLYGIFTFTLVFYLWAYFIGDIGSLCLILSGHICLRTSDLTANSSVVL